MKSNLMILLAIIGGIIGVIIVRAYFLNTIQIMGWNLFWQNLAQLNFKLFKMVFKSATFGKCLLGFLIGGGAGGFLGYIIDKK